MLALRNAAVNQLRYISTRSNALYTNLKSTESSDLEPRIHKRRNNELGASQDGGQVFHGFTYYPRHPGQQDPPYEPTKVLMVQRIHTLKHRPFWEKNICSEMGLSIDHKLSEIALVANTPTNCARLWKVKHLLRITPVTLPKGLPENGDLSGARLQDNGELTFISKLKGDAKLIESTPTTPEREFLDNETIRKRLRLNWLNPYH
uniref:EOG090X0EYV n=1 Tax=Ceriodaphnia reticulata TaxID=302197 RepID=A0A4Y7LY64_9CRUS|nr:EOG090X0EYV [Ceriodaphnia reticulata]SVE73234.1 EOG090X0EYV [Ceriodaphnia reticulata]